jgi:hypothetical protein
MMPTSQMTGAQEYREHAAACLQAAKFAMRADVKAVLTSMAQHWIELAERMERFAESCADEPMRGQLDDKPPSTDNGGRRDSD